MLHPVDRSVFGLTARHAVIDVFLPGSHAWRILFILHESVWLFCVHFSFPFCACARLALGKNHATGTGPILHVELRCPLAKALHDGHGCFRVVHRFCVTTGPRIANLGTCDVLCGAAHAVPIGRRDAIHTHSGTMLKSSVFSSKIEYA
jgi:hypothetical protein